MDILRDLGTLALGSRLKRLSDRLMQDGIRVYRDSGVEFEPKWFPVYYYLSTVGPSAVTDIARGLGITHPSVNQIAREMIATDLVAAYKDTSDKRKRVLALTKRGKAQMAELAIVWKDIRAALQELVDETQVDFLGYVESIERALDERDFHRRFLDRHRPDVDGIEISGWDPALAETFRALNEAWIVEHFEMEEADRRMLEQPREHVIDGGGDILFAKDVGTGEILGTCALVNRGGELAELAKMTVAASARGRGIGKLIARAVVVRARDLGFTRLYLETNSRLAPALGLYRALGFVRKPSPFASDYSRADVYMEMSL
jgi:GNAT superfamily N-acetyltransferase